MIFLVKKTKFEEIRKIFYKMTSYQKDWKFIEIVDLSCENGQQHKNGSADPPRPPERVTRAYTVEVQTASVFYAQSLILLLFEP